MYEIVQAYNRYFHKVDTVSNHLIIIIPVAHFFYFKYGVIHGSSSKGYIQLRFCISFTMLYYLV